MSQMRMVVMNSSIIRAIIHNIIITEFWGGGNSSWGWEIPVRPPPLYATLLTLNLFAIKMVA